MSTDPLIDLGQISFEEALASVCEQRNADALRVLVADARCREELIPLPKITCAGPWDRYILEGTKTVDGRVAYWRKGDRWVPNTAVRPIDGGGEVPPP